VASLGATRAVDAMRHEKYIRMHTEDGVPLDVVLSRFESDLILFLATVEDEFAEEFGEDYE
jgi:hypothetical protein